MDYVDLIDKYLNEEMSPAEKLRFEERMHRNSDLAQDVKIMREMSGFLSQYQTQIDELERSEEQSSHMLILDAWDDPDNAKLASAIRKLTQLLGNLLDAELSDWLRGEAVFYPELLEPMIALIERKQAGPTTPQEIRELYASVQLAFGQYIEIRDHVEEYLFQKRCEEPKQGRIVDFKPTSSKRTIKLQRKTIYLIAASLTAVFIMSSLLWMNFPKGTSSEDLYSQYYAAPDVPSGFRGDGSQAASAVSSGVSAFEQGDYERCASLLSAVKAADKEYLVAAYFAGLSHMELKQFHKAIPALTAVAEGPASNLRTDARWYLALCYLQMNDKPNAVKWLSGVAGSTSAHSSEASSLLDKLFD
jgi:hypothetical protein